MILRSVVGWFQESVETPEAGESLLLRALSCIEDYSKSLIVASNSIENNLKENLSKAAEIVQLSLDNHISVLSEFNTVCDRRIEEFDSLIEAVELICKDLSKVDQLYEDVMKLSDIVSALQDQIVRAHGT